ncbi:unnamed protein product [Victoria cruziana]
MDGSGLHHQTHRLMRPMEQHPSAPPPPQGPWNSPQFQYQPSHPLPPPPHHHYLHHQQQQLPQPPQPQWVPPPDHPQMQFPHPHPPPPPGPSHYGIGSYPPPPHHYPPPPSRPLHHPQVTQMYGQPDQPWSNSSWPKNQYPDHNISHYNEQDWAARARAWAAAKSAMESQQSFSSIGRKEEQSPGYHEYHHTVALHGSDTQQSPVPATSHQPLPASLTDHNRPFNQYQLPTSFVPEPSTYAHDGHPPYTAKDGTFAADAKLLSAAPEGSILSSSSVYQQELPSSYSSVPVAGNSEAGHGSGSHQSSSLPSVSSGSELYSQPAQPIAAVLSSTQSPSYIYGSESAMPVKDVSDQPLDYEHPSAFHKHEHQQQHHISYAHSAPSGLVGGSDQVLPAASLHSWTSPVAAGVAFPTVSPVPPGPQLENSFVPHALPVHAVPVIGGVSGSNFRPTIPPMNAPFGVSAGAPLQLPPAFPTDMNGTFSISERPKKASVPSWLREEIMKKKAAVMSSSIQDQSLDIPSHTSDVDGAEKVFKKVDQEDSKSLDSAKSTEEDDDEDDVEAERSALLNLEIKRILTEVLLKVTDELFDEIATKVMEEDDVVVEVPGSVVPGSNTLPSSTPGSSTPKTSGRVLVPAKHNDTNEAETDKRSSSSSPGGNVLGLVNYASDDDEVDSSGPRNRQRKGIANGEDIVKADLADSHDQIEVSNDGLSASDTQCNAATFKVVSRGTSGDKGVGDITKISSGFSSSIMKSEDENVPTSVEHSGARGGQFDAANKGKTDEVAVSASLLKAKAAGQSCTGPSDREKASIDEADKVGRKKLTDSEYDTRKGTSISRQDQKELETDKIKRGQRESSSSAAKMHDNKNVHKEKAEERNKVDKLKDTGAKPVGKSLDSDSGKSFKHFSSKDDDKLVDRSRGTNVKVDSTRKRTRPTEEKEDTSRHREKKDSHKKHHSLSNSGRGRSSRADSSSSERSGASYGSSDDTRRMRTSKRSPSPPRSRSRKRQVSRSPNSRHSQRKHFSYSSHDARNRR